MYIQIYGQAEFSFISPEPSKKIHPSQASKRSTKSSLAAETRQTRPSCTYGTGTYRYIGRLVFLWRDLIYIYPPGGGTHVQCRWTLLLCMYLVCTRRRLIHSTRPCARALRTQNLKSEYGPKQDKQEQAPSESMTFTKRRQ
jgi:hypothetical protein